MQFIFLILSKIYDSRYRKLYEPFYEQRHEVLTEGRLRPEHGTRIPKFWLAAMKNHQMLQDMIEAVDEYQEPFKGIKWWKG